MSDTKRIASSFFTALPATYFFVHAVFLTEPTEYYWKTDVVVASVLLVGSLSLGFVLPLVLQLFHVRAPWISIAVGGILALGLALFAMTLLNTTPVCVGQDNGDGNNNLGMCMGYVVLAGIVFGSVYLFFLAISAFVGHWAMKAFQ